MPGDKIDVRSLRSKAGALAQLDIEQGRIEAQHWHFRSDEHFARLVLDEAKSIALSHTGYSDSTINDTAYSIAEGIEGLKP